MKTRKFSWLALTLVAGSSLAIPGEACAQFMYFRQPTMLFNYPRWGGGFGGYGNTWGGGYGGYGGGYNWGGYPNYGGYNRGYGMGYPYFYPPAHSADQIVTISPGFGAAGDFYPRMRSEIEPAVGVPSNSPLLEVGTLAPPAFAQISVILPSADARLWFDGKATEQTGELRTFTTPKLDVNRPYAFQIQAQWTDAQGQTQNVSRTINFRAGDVLRVDFTNN